MLLTNELKSARKMGVTESDMVDSFTKAAYFPTLIFQIDVENAKSLNKSLLNSIYNEQKKDREGITRSNVKEFGGWHSGNNLHKSSNYSNLVGHINSATKRMSEELGYAVNQTIKIGTMWSIINPPGSLNIAHVHPGCLWSGVYYVHTPKNSGNIEFIEPRTVHLMNQPKFLPNTKRPKDCWTKVNFKPKEGRMIIFPSWLYHSVRPNSSTETGRKGERIIVSFNLSQHRTSAK